MMDKATYESLLSGILVKAEKLGFDESQASYFSGISMEVSVLNGEVNSFERSSEQGIRFKGKKNGFFIGMVVAAFARFLIHYVVGATVWAEYMPETFFGMTMHSPWFYSMLYNGSYMLIDMVLCLIIGLLLWKPLQKFICGNDLKAA